MEWLGSLVTQRRLISLNLRKYGLSARKALGWPIFLTVIVFRHGGCIGWKYEPWLLGRGEDVNVRWQVVRVIEGTNPNEPKQWACAREGAPNRNSTNWAAGNLLAEATC